MDVLVDLLASPAFVLTAALGVVLIFAIGAVVLLRPWKRRRRRRSHWCREIARAAWIGTPYIK